MYVIYAYLFGGKGWCLFRWELLAFGFILEDGDVCESNVWPRFVALSIALRPDVLRTILQIPQRACPVTRVPSWWKVGWRRLVDWKLILITLSILTPQWPSINLLFEGPKPSYTGSNHISKSWLLTTQPGSPYRGILCVDPADCVLSWCAVDPAKLRFFGGMRNHSNMKKKNTDMAKKRGFE